MARKGAQKSKKRKSTSEGDQKGYEKRLKLMVINEPKAMNVNGGKKKAKAKKSKKTKGKINKNADDHTRGFVTHCRPKGLYNLVQRLNDKQKEDVKSIGFGGLLHLSIKSCNTKILQWLVRNFNGKSRMLTIDSHRSFAVTPDDIYDAFLLPRNGGCDVLKLKREEPSHVLVHLKDTYNIDRLSPLKLVEDVIVHQLSGGGADFKRLFVVYCLSSFLTPSSNRMVRLSTVKSLVDVESISKLDWCSFVLKKLCSAAEKYNSSRTLKNVCGCVILLQILYFHRLKWEGVAEPCTLPLLQHWSEIKMRERSNEEFKAGGYGQGELVVGTYPVCTKKVEREGVEKNDLEGSSDGSSRYIEFKLSSDDLDDAQIHSMAKNDIHERFLLFKRDISVVFSHHMKNLLKMKEEAEDKQTHISSDSPVLSESQKNFSNGKFQKYIDGIAEKIIMMTNIAEEMPSFDLPTPEKGNDVEETGDEGVPEEMPSFDLLEPVKGNNIEENAGDEGVPEEIPSFDLLEPEKGNNVEENAGDEGVPEEMPSFDLPTPEKGNTVEENAGDEGVPEEMPSFDLLIPEKGNAVEENAGNEGVPDNPGDDV